MKKDKLQHAEIKFNHDGKPYTFVVIHNLHDFGLDIMDAFTNWTARTDNILQAHFIDYVKSKDPVNIICLSEAEYKAIMR